MNTLSKSITSQILKDPNTYTAIRRQWSQLMNSDRRRGLSSAHHLLYLALCGKDWRKGFTMPTNKKKLNNGAYYGWGLHRALAKLHSKLAEGWLLKPFAGLVTLEMLERVRQYVPWQNPYLYKPEDFENGSFPFEAYAIPQAIMTEAKEDGNASS